MTFTTALDSGNKVSIVDCIMVDINYRLKVVFKSSRSKFFSDDDSLNEAIEQEKIQWILIIFSLTISDLKSQIQFSSYKLVIFFLLGSIHQEMLLESGFSTSPLGWLLLLYVLNVIN